MQGNGSLTPHSIASVAQPEAVTTAIKIDKGVPVPWRAGIRGPKPKYPWERMEVGDSFLVPLAGRKPVNVQAGLNHTRKDAEERYGHKYGVHIVEENGVRVVRVWRVA